MRASCGGRRERAYRVRTMRNDDQHRKRVIKALTITVVILAMIVVVAYFARQKVTSWLTYAAAGQSAVNGPFRVGKIVCALCPRGETVADDFAHPTALQAVPFYLTSGCRG